MALKFDYDKSALKVNLETMKEKVPIAVLMYASTKAGELQAKMKINRPWTDRTGMAKTMLDAKASRVSDDVIRITLMHGVEYGLWLELAHEKNYAIIAPTITSEGPKIIEDLGNLMSKITI